MTQGANNKINKSGLQYIVRIYAQLLLLAVAFFIAAGDLNILRAWIYFGIAAVSYIVSSSMLINYNPNLINERAKERENTKSWDKVLVGLYLLLGLLGIHIIAGLDSRFGWSSPSIKFLIPGAVLYIIAAFGQVKSMLVNKHFEVSARIQDDREHQVVKEGPYKLVRHPGYASVILSFIAIPFIIGSLYALICSAAVFIIMFIRTALEDKMLQEELPGYSQYTTEVKFRLIPGIW